MGILSKFKNDKRIVATQYKMITEAGEGFYSFNGKLYQSDLIRSCIRPKAQSVGKAIGKHIRRNGEELTVNPDAYIKFLLEEPNPLMTGQMLQEKLTTQLMLNNNAFALIQRDSNDLPCAIYPINSNTVDALQDSQGNLFLRFYLGVSCHNSDRGK